ncbi:MAG: sigma-70 family RNA polymerase sigma factor [Herpetosiphonaceae bacterium]|nr:sigma-70 family RNA polymerase sigma factor [Herpetosiphonaceae bacterium]
MDDLYTDELPDDETLLLLIGRADQLALSWLYARYGRLLYSIALRITGDGQATEEILQDVFHSVWQRAAQFRPAAGSVQTWLTSITRNRAIDEVRSRWYRASSNTLSLDALPELSAKIERGLEQMAIVRADIQAALSTLPALQRQVIEMSYFGGLSSQEIAQWFGEPVGTIKSRLRTGLEKLRVAVNSWLESD